MMNLPLNPKGKFEQAEIEMREKRREIAALRLGKQLRGESRLFSALRDRLRGFGQLKKDSSVVVDPQNSHTTPIFRTSSN